MTARKFRLRISSLTAWAGLLFAALMLAAAAAPAQEISLEFKPADSKIGFELGAALHSVHGAFELKRGVIHYNPVSGAISGEIVADAASGNSGNDSRDQKMHREVLESQRYPEIVFRPDRVDGKVSAQGTSTVQVHGIFALHGAEHEITVPVQVKLTTDHWTASSRFSIPYVQWGLKNPSTFLLRVSQSVDIEVEGSGKIPAAPGGASQ